MTEEWSAEEPDWVSRTVAGEDDASPVAEERGALDQTVAEERGILDQTVAEERAARLEALHHDPSGVDLARQIAASVSATKRGVRKPRRRTRPSGPLSSGAHPDDRDPMLLGAALDRLVEAKGWNTQVNIHLLLGNWPKLVGRVNAEHSAPEAFQDGILTVRASSTAWATQLRLFAPQLVARLNAELGDGSVTRVEVKGPDAPSWKHGRRSVKGRGPRDTYG